LNFFLFPLLKDPLSLKIISYSDSWNSEPKGFLVGKKV